MVRQMADGDSKSCVQHAVGRDESRTGRDKAGSGIGKQNARGRLVFAIRPGSCIAGAFAEIRLLVSPAEAGSCHLKHSEKLRAEARLCRSAERLQNLLDRLKPDVVNSTCGTAEQVAGEKIRKARSSRTEVRSEHQE